MKLFITGGAGFIGCNFIRHMLNSDCGYEVMNFDKLTYAGDRRNLQDIEGNPKYKFIQGDIADADSVDRAIEDADCIINFAAESHVDYSISRPTAFLDTNVKGTSILLEAARKRDCKYIQISTDEVYGDKLEGACNEGSILRPSNPYSASKAAADMLVLAHMRTYGLDAKITRTTNNLGPYQLFEKLVPKFTISALLGKKLTVYGKGDSRRDFIYVADNCEAIKTVLEKGKNGEIYHIGAGNEETVLTVAEEILKLLDKPKELITYGKERPGEDKRYFLDFEKIKGLGWEPGYDFSKALRTTVQWYVDNRWWWEKKVENYDFSKRQAAQA